MDRQCSNNCISDAHWYCRKCNVSYCFQCVKKKDFKFQKKESYVNVCPECNRMLTWTGVDSIIEPWDKGLVTSFLFPFSLKPLPVFVLLTVGGFLFSDSLLINEVLFGILLFVMHYYSFNVIKKTLSGEESPPDMTLFSQARDLDYNRIVQLVKYFVGYLAVSGLFFMSLYLGIAIVPFLLIVVPALVFPYLLMQSCTAKHGRGYFNRSLFITVMKKNRIYYPVSALLFVPPFAMIFLFSFFPPPVVLPLVCYVMIVNHRIIGKMIIKCHSELNFYPDYEAFKGKYTLESLHGFKV